MKNFIEVTTNTGEKTLINVKRIFRIEPLTDGCTVYFDSSFDYKTHSINVLNGYEELKSTIINL